MVWEALGRRRAEGGEGGVGSVVLEWGGFLGDWPSV